MTDQASPAHGVDLTALGQDQLKSLIADAQARHREVAEDQRKALVEEISNRVEAMGLDVASFFSSLVPGGNKTAARSVDTAAPVQRAGGGKGSRGAVPVKYRDPQGNTWTGRGRTPRWLVQAEAKGSTRADFAV